MDLRRILRNAEYEIEDVVRNTVSLSLVTALLVGSASSPAMAATKASPGVGGFGYRGVIEGFYGPPWPRPARIPFLRWMLRHNMNLYVHAPKDDPYQRIRWRDFYPPEDMVQFKSEVASVQPRGLRWVPSISPGHVPGAAEGADICYSCPEDREALFQKLDSLWGIGIRAFMLSFDDVERDSTHPQDWVTYGTGDDAFGRMNADLLNDVYERYRSQHGDFRLFTVPADFAGTTSTPYLDALRSRLRQEVIVMWTGPAVVSPTISCADADAYAAAIGRKPLVWDNFPVNDFAPDKLMVGPYEGRSMDLPACLAGIVANPSPLVATNRISLFTVADYLRNPSRYSPEESWRASLREFATDHVRVLLPFVQNVRSTELDPTESVRFTRLRDRLLSNLDRPGWPTAYRELRQELLTELRTPSRLRRAFRARRFLAEVDDKPRTSWLERLRFNSRNGLETLGYVSRTRPWVTARFDGRFLRGRVRSPADAAANEAHLVTISNIKARDDGNPDTVHGSRLPDAPRANRMDEFFDAAAAHLALYQEEAAQATTSLTVMVDGREVAVGLKGRFRVAVRDAQAVVVAIDGAGHRSRFVFMRR